MTNKNWKNSEAYLKSLYESFNIPAHLESKDGRFQSRSTYDVRILAPSEVEFTSDSKYSKATFRHHTLLEGIEKLYNKKSHQKAVLFTKNYSRHGGVISVRDNIFAGLLAYWLGTMDRAQILEQWGVKDVQ